MRAYSRLDEHDGNAIKAIDLQYFAQAKEMRFNVFNRVREDLLDVRSGQGKCAVILARASRPR